MTMPQRDWPDNDRALLQLMPDGKTKLPENYWSINDAFQGTQIFGATGSGKSSGSGQSLARAFMDANFGGLVLTAKTDEIFAWRKYAEAADRLDDLLIVDDSARFRFNFLGYELNRPGVGAGHTENIVNLFCSVLEASERRSGQGGPNDGYWQRALKQLLRNAIDLTVIATGNLDLPKLYRIIATAPRSAEEAASEEWQNDPLCDCSAALELAEKNAKEKDRENDFAMARDYWLREFPCLAPDTRSGIVSTFTSMADCFLRGVLRRLFCTDTNFGPESSFEGKVIVLNLPVKEYNELGQFAQVLFKYVWQRAVERRIPPQIDRKLAEETIRPVFLWADESQFFANSYDAHFQSTARSSRAATVYLTQNLPSYMATFGGSNSRAEVEAFVGNLQTKIFHANGDPVTNNWAADSIGKTMQMRYSGGMSEQLGHAGPNVGLSQSAGGQQQMDLVVQPQEFTMLRSGGEECDMQVDSIIFQGGRRWLVPAKGEKRIQNFIRHAFPQNP